MTPERWQKVEEVLQAALDCPEPERAELLARACAGDPDLERETMSLIDAHTAAGDFLEQPALEQDAHLLIEDEDRSVGASVGHYKIVERLGSGGMGEVYLARDEKLGRLVALKVLPSYFASDEARLRRFQTEARAASALNHTNIFTVYEVGESDGTHFIATEYIEGQTIRELIDGGKLSLGEVFDIAIQMVSGLSAAHSAGIVHRDVKPENVIRRNDGTVKILDFGIAKLIERAAPNESSWSRSQIDPTEFGVLIGTVNYISPEQARGLSIDVRTDIWSAGVVLYEMLSGRRPFAGATNADTIVGILEREPTKLFGDSLVPVLAMMQSAVEKALKKNVEARYLTAEEMLADLNAIKVELQSLRAKKRTAIDSATAVGEAQTLAAISPAPHRARLIGALVMVLLVISGIAYVRNKWRAPAIAPKQIYAQMNEAEQLRFLGEQEQRVAAMMGERPVRLNDEALRSIKSQVDRYVGLRPDPNYESAAVVFGRAGPYIPVIANAFTARRIPVVVGIYLPMIESAYRPCFENSAGAKGLFQFLPVTAEQYGVARADMCDVDKMAPAAAHYIADRMAELGDDSQSMTLVLLSYNRGANSVRDELRLLRETDRNYERNFWTLFANRDKLDAGFRRESVYYVPAFFAAAIIGENPEAFELKMPPLSSLVK